MSCTDEKNCDQARQRRRALVMLGLMMLVFIVLSGFSFLDSRGQVTPDKISFGKYHATDGKRVFQAYNCMDCHTMVGNGAYFAPDLTKEYKDAGPAWLAAFLPSPGGWPTEAALRTQLANPDVAADAGVSTLEAYYEKFPGARDRIERRGGGKSLMPNLPFHGDEIGQLIAYLKYTSAMDTEGWPPKVETGSLAHRLSLLHDRGGEAVAPVTAVAESPAGAGHAAAAPADPATLGQQEAQNYGCMACHSAGHDRLVGPGWGGLYGSQVTLADGKSVTADEAYLTESILSPNAKIVAGFGADVMPQTYHQLLKDDEVKAIVAYIRSLEKH